MKPKTKKRITYALLSTLVVVVGALTIAAKSPDFALGRNIQILFNMFRELSLLYVDEIDPEKLLLNAADGMTSELDPYTELIPEKEMADFEIMTTGKYGGMGAIIQKKGDYVMVAQPYKGSPADKAGLQIGDLILAVDGKDVKGMEIQQVSSLLKGTPGTELHIKVRKLLTDQEQELTIKRERIVVSALPYWGVIADSIGYISHKEFTEDCSTDIRNAFLSMKKEGIKGLIIDLRGNGGGILQEAVKILSMFVPKGTEVVSMRGRMKEMDAGSGIDQRFIGFGCRDRSGSVPGSRPRCAGGTTLLWQRASPKYAPGWLQLFPEVDHRQILHPQRTLHSGTRLFASGSGWQCRGCS